MINSPNWPTPQRAFFFPPDITLDQAHGRHDTREVYPFEVSPEETGFPYTAQAAVIVRTTHHLKSINVTQETEIVISSRDPSKMSAAEIQAFRRGHWTLESVHYVRDVSLGEDASLARTKHAPNNLAALRNLLVGLCALDGARKNRRVTYMPRFRSAAQNDRQVAVDLICRPLLNGS